LGMGATEGMSIDDGGPVATSFPIFEPLMTQLGASISRMAQ
jgi:3-phosphoshikimate 1-carboxyvinyltransferase